MVDIKLTSEQLEFLSELLYKTEDEGPVGYGWQSSELIEISRVISDYVNKGDL